MTLKKLTLHDFRNFNSLNLTPSKGVNIVYGQNAQGKTNILEAINLLASLKSYRGAKDQELFRWGSNATSIKGEVDSSLVEIIIQNSEKKVLVNNSPKSVLEAWGVLKVVSFYPQELFLLTTSPDQRRKYFDSLISFLDRKYLKSIIDLHKILRNRNKVLFFIKDRRVGEEQLDVWDEALIETGVQVWLKRFQTLKKINRLLKEKEAVFIKGKASVDYISKIGARNMEEKELLKEVYRKKLSELRGQEIERSVSLLGPHRDDFKFLLEHSSNQAFQGEKESFEKDLSLYGSRGEQKSVLLTLKMAELDLIEEETSQRPLLLLDEVLAELDQNHQQQLLKLVKRQQTFITSTNLDRYPNEILSVAKIFRVEEGKVFEENI